MEPHIIPRLPVPVFTNLGFQSFNLHVYVEYVRRILPDMHPMKASVIHRHLEEMHRAFDDYDLKKFRRLQTMINSQVARESIEAEARGEFMVVGSVNRYFTELSSIVNTMRDTRLVIDKG